MPTELMRNKPLLTSITSWYVDALMIAELFPQFYDFHDRKVFRPGKEQRRAGFRPAFPMGRYLTQPLKHTCADLEQMRKFLVTCRARDVSRPADCDYWQLPEDFERVRIGDCADFSLWAWRQLLAMGYTARFTGGRMGKLQAGHAWVTFEKSGRFYLLESPGADVGYTAASGGYA